MSNTAKHTPGPWQVRGKEIATVQDNFFIASVEGEMPMKHDIPNAHLIAAAPAMYRELGIVREYLMKLYEQGNSEAGQYAASVETTLAQADGQT